MTHAAADLTWLRWQQLSQGDIRWGIINLEEKANQLNYSPSGTHISHWHRCIVRALDDLSVEVQKYMSNPGVCGAIYFCLHSILLKQTYRIYGRLDLELTDTWWNWVLMVGKDYWDIAHSAWGLNFSPCHKLPVKHSNINNQLKIKLWTWNQAQEPKHTQLCKLSVVTHETFHHLYKG